MCYCERSAEERHAVHREREQLSVEPGRGVGVGGYIPLYWKDREMKTIGWEQTEARRGNAT